MIPRDWYPVLQRRLARWSTTFVRKGINPLASSMHGLSRCRRRSEDIHAMLASPVQWSVPHALCNYHNMAGSRWQIRHARDRFAAVEMNCWGEDCESASSIMLLEAAHVRQHSASVRTSHFWNKKIRLSFFFLVGDLGEVKSQTPIIGLGTPRTTTLPRLTKKRNARWIIAKYEARTGSTYEII